MNTRFKTLAALVLAGAAWIGAPAIADAACKGGAPNGTWDKLDGEGCDDGNSTNGDGCSSTCTIEANYTCGLAIPFEGLTTWAYGNTANDANWTAGFSERTQTKNTKSPTFAHFGINAENIGNAVLELYINQGTYNGDGQHPDTPDASNGGDDDWVGFVLGFDPQTANTSTGSYLLVDWKAIAQSFSGGRNDPSWTSPAGLTLSVVEGIPAMGTEQYGRDSDFWRRHDGNSNTNSKVRVIARATGSHTNPQQNGQSTYGTTGWKNRIRYRFQFEYSPTNLVIKVSEETGVGTGVFGAAQVVFNLTAADAGLTRFPEGEIGFFGLSQPNARYALTQPLSSVCAAVAPVEIHGPDVTFVPRPSISGVGTPGATVTVGLPGGYTRNVTVQPDGTWTHTPQQDLPVGDTTVTASQTYGGAPSSDTHTITRYAPHYVEITTPNTSTPTTVATPTIAGTTTPGSSVTVTIENDTSTGGGCGPVTANAAGEWSCTPATAIPDGSWTITATSSHAGATDATDTAAYKVDTTTTVEITGPADGSTSAVPVKTISGTGEPGATIALTIDGVAIGTATVASNGTWSIQLTNGLLHKQTAYAISATATDTLGNQATDNSEVTVNIPIAISVTSPADGSVTNDVTPQIRGTATPNAIVHVDFSDGTTLFNGCSARTSAAGAWSCSPTDGNKRADGEYTIIATATSEFDTTRTAVDDANTFTIDTETYVAITGPANNTTVTSTVSTITGTGEPGGKVKVSIDGIPQTDINGDPVVVTVGSDGTWSFPLEDPIDSGSHTAIATITDDAGNTMSNSSDFAVVTAIDVLITSHTTGSTHTTPITTISGTGDADGVVVVTITGKGGSTYSYTSSEIAVEADGTWSVTLPTNGALLHGQYTVQAYIEHELDDTINNRHSVDINVNLDTEVDITELRDNNGVIGPISQGPLAEVRGTTEAGNEVHVTIKNGNGDDVVTGDAVVAADGTWTFALLSPLANDDKYTVEVEAENTHGHTANDSATVTIDTQLDVEITSHSDGEETDLPIASVGGTTDPNAEVSVTVTDEAGTPTTYGPVTADANGDWTLTFPTPLESGTWTFLAEAEDAAGNTADFGPIDVTVTVNNCTDAALNDCDSNAACTPTGPGTHTCECNEGYEGDGKTCDETPYVEIEGPADGTTVRTGTPVFDGNANPNQTVAISITDDGGNVVLTGTVTTDNDGNWSWTPDDQDALAEGGPYTITTTVDLGNGTTPATDSIDFRVDLSTDIVIDSPADGDTISSTPTITGTAQPGAPVEVRVNGKTIGTTTADANGQWSVTVPTEHALPIGPATITAEDTSNQSTDEVDVLVERDIIPVKITGPADKTSTTDRQPTVTGTGEPGTRVTILVDGTPVGTVPVDANGNWTWTPSDELELGSHTITARGEDGSEDSITIDVENGDMPFIGGGRLLGCNSGEGQAPSAIVLLAGAALIALSRRRTARRAA